MSMESVPLPAWMSVLSRHRKPTGFALFGLALLLLLLAGWLGYKYKWDQAPVVIWCILVSLAAFIAGGTLSFGEGDAAAGFGNPRIAVLVFGGLIGFATWLLSVVLAWNWRSTILGGTEAWEGENWWRIWVVILAMLVGLGVLFGSLLLARSVERTNPLLRRLLYGFNACLSGMLLLAILIFANVLVYTRVTASSDWTEAGIYSLSDRSINVLKALDKPTKFYVFTLGDATLGELRTLVDNCRNVNDKIKVEYLSTDWDRDRIRELQLKHSFTLSDRGGLLIVYGAEPDTSTQFIKESDMIVNDPDSAQSQSRRPRFLFKGEDALITALSFLEEGKSRATIYVLQGNGELDLKDTDSSQPGVGLGALRERLQKGNYDVKGLQLVQTAALASKDPLTVNSTRVPDDASLVLIAGPKAPMPDYALKALGDYLNPSDAAAKKGKLVVFLDLALDPAKNLIKTGMEGFLAGFGVDVGDERVLSVPTNVVRNPLNVIVMTLPSQQNPVAEAFLGRPFLMQDVRPMRPRPSGPTPPPGGLSAEPLLVAPGLRGPFRQGQIWTEKNFRLDALQYVSDLVKADKEEELVKRLSEEAIPVAAAVTEPATPTSAADAHAFMRGQERKPRILAFGSSTFVSNFYMTESKNSLHFVLFSSALSWLREKPANIGLEPKKRNIFVLDALADENLVTRMQWLPGFFLFAGIMGIGTGVWIVRRR